MKAPATLDEFYAMFPTERRCWAYLRRLRWPQGFRCPRCGARKAHRLRTRALWQCSRCRYQTSVTAGTPFHGTRVPLRTWFLAAFFVARHKKGISSLQFQRTAGLGSYKTAWLLLHKVRSTLGHNPLFPLTGDVEADETYVGARKPGGPRGRGAPGKTVVGVAVENRGEHAGKVRLVVLEGISSEDLQPFVRGAIDAREATVRTDGLQGYHGLRRAGVRHRARVQRHPQRAPKILPWAHTVASNLKTWLRGTFHGVTPKHLPRYLDEFSYRFDHRWREGELFAFVLRRVACGEPMPYHLLVAERTA